MTDDSPDLHAAADQLRAIAAQPAADRLDARHRAHLDVAAATLDTLTDDPEPTPNGHHHDPPGMSPLEDVQSPEVDK